MWFTVPVEDASLEAFKLRKTEANLEAEVVHLVRLLSHIYPSILSAAIPSRSGFDRELDWFVYILLPTGQVSWHIRHEYKGLFSHLQVAPISPWDGHGQEEKWQRITRMLDGTALKDSALP